MEHEHITYGHLPRKRVGSAGPNTAEIVIIGEAPGAQEEATGVPFVGASGQLLRNSLAKAGIVMEDCYITNVIKERPPNNNADIFITGSKRGVTTTKEFDAYHTELRREIASLPNVRLIIPAGNIALWAVTGKWGILNWRGSVLDSTLVPGHKALPIIHPAATMHGEYLNRHLIDFDLRRAAAFLNDPSAWEDTSEYIIKPSSEAAFAFLNECENAPLVAFDIEVSYGEVSCISFSCDKSRAISIPFIESGTKEYFTPPIEAAIWKKIAGILENPAIEKVGHNVVFDASFLHDRYGICAVNLHDTMIATGILFPEFKKGLGMVTSIATRFPYYKDEGKEQIMQGGGYGETFWLYNAKDSLVLMHALPALLADLERMGNLDTYEKQRQLIQPLLYMARRGMPINMDGLSAASKEAQARMVEIEIEVTKLTGRALNLNSPTQLKAYFYDEHKVKPYVKQGKATTDEKAITRLIANRKPEVSEMARLVAEHRKLSKADGTYYQMGFDPDNRLRCSPNPVGTIFGRISTSQTIFGTGGNMQNLPKNFKKYVLVDDGYVGFNVDLAQAENRITAYVALETSMIEAFESGLDMHRYTASGIFNKPYEEITDEGEPGYVPASIAGGKHSERYYGKRANHALNYGMREGRAALEWEIPVEDARFIVERYHRTYPGIRRWHGRVEAEVNRTRMLTNLYGRRFRFMNRWDTSLLLAANSFIPQSTNADHLNRNGVLPLYYNQEAYGEAEFLSQVHDSITYQVPLAAGWLRIAEMMLSLKRSLETPLIAHANTPNEISFVIPADFTLFRTNYADGREFKASKWKPEWHDAEQLALALSAAYNT